MDERCLFESLTTPLSYTTKGKASSFTVDGVQYTVLVDKEIVNNVTCSAIGFESSKTGSDAPLNNSPKHTNHVFSTILVIAREKMLPCDLVFIEPDDIKLDVLGRELNLYHTMVKRLERSRVFIKTGKVSNPSLPAPFVYGIPTFSTVDLTEEDIIDLAKEYGRIKQSRPPIF